MNKEELTRFAAVVFKQTYPAWSADTIVPKARDFVETLYKLVPDPVERVEVPLDSGVRLEDLAVLTKKEPEPTKKQFKATTKLKGKGH